MGFFLASFGKDISRWRREPISFLVWLGLPFLMGGMLTLLMSGDGAKPHGTLLLADEDKSFVSGIFANAFAQEGLAGLITVVPVERADGLTRIDKGEGSALLVIPDGFGERIFKQEPVEVTLRKNPSQTILPAIIQETVEILLDAGFYLQATFGEDLKTISGWIEGDGLPQGDAVGALADRVRTRFEGVGDYMDPLALEVRVAEEVKKKPGPSLALLFVPGILVMSGMFAMQGLANDLWAERAQGTLRRLASSPRGPMGFFAGKVAAAGTIMAFLTIVIIAAAFSYHGVGLDRVVPTLVWMTISGVAIFSWFAVIQMAVPTRQAASVVTLILIFPLLMVGGSFFPFDTMPEWMQVMGEMSPNGFMVRQLTVEITGPDAWSIAPEKWGVLAAIAGSGLVLAVALLHLGFAKRQDS